MNVKIEQSWQKALQEEFDKEYFERLTDFVRNAYRMHTCYPPGGEIFNAFNLCPLDKVKVVILGQDPYHGPGQAEGLCFSVKPGIALPPSLVNILKEIKSDVGTEPPVVYTQQTPSLQSPSLRSPSLQSPSLRPRAGERPRAGGEADGSLRRWAKQGVLLLNTTLTVQEHAPASHQRHGWETFTDAVIKKVSDTQQHVVFLLWGGPARSKKKLIDTTKHLVLESVHPSPLSANRGGWFGNHHFSKCNAWLEQQGFEPIRW